MIEGVKAVPESSGQQHAACCEQALKICCLTLRTYNSDLSPLTFRLEAILSVFSQCLQARLYRH